MISLVMIVKNEEKILRTCLDSVKSIVDQFVVVDTGSTDGTKAIIAEYGTVYEVPFTNFVETKNAALKLATEPYILFMDADEILLDGHLVLKRIAEENIVGGVFGKIIEGEPISNTYYRCRLWRNDGTWVFVGPGVHEAVSGTGSVGKRSDIVVRHNHAHRTAESYTKRFEWYVTILLAHLDKNPNDARALFYLARAYKDLGRPLAAVDTYKLYLATNSSFRDEVWQANYDSAECLKSLGEYDAAKEFLTSAIKVDQRRSEAYLLMGRMYQSEQSWDTAVFWYEKAIRPVPEDILLFVNPRAYDTLPMDEMVLCLDRQKKRIEARAVCSELNEKTNFRDTRVRNNLWWLDMNTRFKIFLTLGKTPEPVYPGMIEKQGVGGVETTYIELARELSNRGHEVFVFSATEEEGLDRHVRYIPFQNIGEYARVFPDILITSRWFDPMYLFPGAKKIIWLQDAHFADPNRPDAFSISNAVVCSSPWHRQYIAERYGEGIAAKKLHVIPLGVRKGMFGGETVIRKEKQVVYSSNPNRGLSILGDMWSKIVDQVPEVSLVITYGWEGLRTWSQQDSWTESVRREEIDIKKKFDGYNVVFTGRLPKRDLYRVLRESVVCAYPNNFWESFCFTALETQCAGVPMITTRQGALTTTLSQDCNVLIDGDPNGQAYQQKFVQATVDLLQNKSKQVEMAEKCMSYAEDLKCDWEDITDTWERVLVEAL